MNGNQLDINKIGPGAWYLIHMFCANAKTENEISSVHDLLEMVSKYFFCLQCRKHFKKNIDKFPPPKVNKYNELFTWSVEMHNKVNSINGKPIVDSKDIEPLYSGKESTCIGDCGNKNNKVMISDLLLDVLSGQSDYTRYN